MTTRPEFESQASGLLLPEIREILRTNPGELNEVTEELHPADLADMVTRLEDEEVPLFFSSLPVDRAADVAEYLDETLRARLVTALDPDRAARIVGAMTPDDRADVLAELDPGENGRGGQGNDLLDLCDRPHRPPGRRGFAAGAARRRSAAAARGHHVRAGGFGDARR